jgi:adenosine deaminase
MCRKIRSYQITNGGDLKVDNIVNDQEQNISREYQNIAEDKRRNLIEAFIDVFRINDGNTLRIEHHIYRNPLAQRSFDLLWEIYHDDLHRDSGIRALRPEY